MAQIYNVLNQLYLKIINGLVDSFPEIENLKTEQLWIVEILQKDAVGKDIYKRLKPNLEKVTEMIHLKNIKAFDLEDIALFEHLCAKKIFFERLAEEEKDIFWSSLQNLIKQMGLVQSCSSCLPSMETLLKSFQEKNPGVDMRDPGIQGLMMKQLISDPELGKKIGDIFNDKNEETSLLANIPDKLRALGLTTLNTKNTIEIEEVDSDDETKEEEEVNKETKQQEILSAADMFKQTRKNRRKHKKKNQNKNVFAAVAEMMSDKKLDSLDFTEMTKDISGFFDGSNATNQAEMKQIMDQFISTGTFTGLNPQELMESMKNGIGMEELMKKFSSVMN